MNKSLFSIPPEDFSYQYLAGPLDSPEAIETGFTEGNCRFALQLYFYRVHDIFLEIDEVYLPGGYEHLGEFIVREQPIDWSLVQPGDIIYAQNLKKKDGTPHKRDPEHYDTLADWRFDFHSAIYLGTHNGQHYIYHASSICDGPDVWTLAQFSEYYKPISIKRILQ